MMKEALILGDTIEMVQEEITKALIRKDTLYLAMIRMAMIEKDIIV